ncbi:zinc ribbon domain-containing protein [Lysinibacillus sp. NPDC094177]|uniref:zinc ribbon domain-containing protein n=1 Tax=Lysinibacillus sp. NPDC094177 TaxID=3390580 RepID=UPI003CFE0DB3
MFCNQCGRENPEDSKYCSGCGGSLEIDNGTKEEEKNIPEKRGSKKKLIISIIIGLILVIGGIGAFIVYQKKQEEKRVQEYVGEMAINSFNMYLEVVENAMVIAMYSKTWSEAIDYGNDFNVELANLKDAYKEKGELQDLKDAQTEIQQSMKYLQDVPEGYEETYGVLKEMYGVYVELADQAQSPTGSLLTFNNKTNDLFSKFNSLFEEYLITMPADVKEEYETYVKKQEKEKEKENEKDADM